MNHTHAMTELPTDWSVEELFDLSFVLCLRPWLC